MNYQLTELAPAAANGIKRVSDVEGVPKITILGYRRNRGNISMVPGQ